jgi:hypothetical protein
MKRQYQRRHRRAAFIAVATRTIMTADKNAEVRARAQEAVRKCEAEIARKKRLREMPGKTVMAAVHGQGAAGAICEYYGRA